MYVFDLKIKLEQGYLEEYASAMVSSGHTNYKIEDVDHMDICKPPTKDHPSYSLLLDCLKVCREVRT